MAVIDISGFAPNSITDGPGLRFGVFCQGCNHNCPGCHNPETHRFGIGVKYDVEDIYKMIKKDPIVRGVTFSGGEPFDQAEGFWRLAKLLKADGYELAAYSGYTFEQLSKDKEDYKYKLLSLLDILVDGPFVLAKRSLSAGFRGSTNQRVLNVPASLEKGEAVWEISARWQTLNAEKE